MYKRIGDYGIIGDMHSAALVGIDGSIDWCCLSRFDSPSVFAALLDESKGGRFQISPLGEYEVEQNYEPDTNVLATTFHLPGGDIRLTDYMPCFMKRAKLEVFHEIHRRIYCLRGRATMRILFEPRLNYASGRTEVEVKDRGCIARNENEIIALTSDVELRQGMDAAVGEFELSQAERKWFIVSHGEERVCPTEECNPELKLSKTRDFWETWVRKCRYRGRWRKQVIRSALLLKLLTYEPTGATIAAPTTSLPEEIGGSRNWDYRYSWVRDSGFALWSLHLLGYGGEGLKYIRWLVDLCLESPEDMCIMYSLDGHRELGERVLDHLGGYKGSRPVRVGNVASTQHQQDIYGIVVDAIYFLHKYGGLTKEIYEGFVRPLVNFVCVIWAKPDHGIWEIRMEPKPFVHSDFWCWAALDRGIRIAKELGYDGDVQTWKPVKERIKREVLAKGWSPEKKAFTMYYGSKELDAANLLMPLVRFLPANHPKVKATIERTKEELAEDGLLYRYKFPNGLESGEGAFTVCNFWLVDCLTKLGRLEEAKQLFERLLSYANHLGLYSEEIDPSTRELLGNFPQAYVHMGLINSAVHLDRALSKRR